MEHDTAGGCLGAEPTAVVRWRGQGCRAVSGELLEEAMRAWIDMENPSDVLVHGKHIIDDSDELPIVRHSGEW